MLSTRKNQTWFPSILNDFMGNDWMAKVMDSTPAINIIECDKRFRVEISTPGMSKDDFMIEIKNENHLEITMEKKCEKAQEANETENDDKENISCSWSSERDEDLRKGKYIRHEFAYSQFRQTLILPDNVDKTKISAKQENGILTILLPKKDSYIEAKATKRITIE